MKHIILTISLSVILFNSIGQKPENNICILKERVNQLGGKAEVSIEKRNGEKTLVVNLFFPAPTQMKKEEAGRVIMIGVYERSKPAGAEIMFANLAADVLAIIGNDRDIKKIPLKLEYSNLVRFDGCFIPDIPHHSIYYCSPFKETDLSNGKWRQLRIKYVYDNVVDIPIAKVD